MPLSLLGEIWPHRVGRRYVPGGGAGRKHDAEAKARLQWSRSEKVVVRQPAAQTQEQVDVPSLITEFKKWLGF